jgi:hypothetical protein
MKTDCNEDCDTCKLDILENCYCLTCKNIDEPICIHCRFCEAYEPKPIPQNESK